MQGLFEVFLIVDLGANLVKSFISETQVPEFSESCQSNEVGIDTFLVWFLF